MRVIAILVITAGCFSKPPRPDNAPDGSTGPTCLLPPVSDTFDSASASPCGAGFEDDNPSSTVARDGVLSMEVAQNLVNDASCSWDMTFDEGAFVEVRQHLGRGGSYTILQVSSGAELVAIQVIDETTAVLKMSDSVQPGSLVELPYDSNEMRWWRLRPEGGLVIGEYSQNGKAWNLLGSSITPAPIGLTQVSLNAGAYLAIDEPDRAEFDNFNVCP